MTTITNFLQGNFIEHENLQQKQTPIWVMISGTSGISVLPDMRNYLIQQCTSNNRPLLHLDLGMTTLKSVKQEQKIAEFQIPIYKKNDSKNYYIVRWVNKQRKYPNSLKQILQTINSFHSSQFVKQQKSKVPQKFKTSMGLLIEGIQLVSTLPGFSLELESFITSLSNLSKVYKQITVIISLAQLLKQEHRFALERISTCLTVLKEPKQVNQWMCLSTVRRYTGFSNQEQYVIKCIQNKNGNKIKVEKLQKQKVEEQSEAHKQMVSALGFKVTKASTDSDITDQSMKKMIYPQYMVQDKIKKGQSKPKCGNCEFDMCHGCDGDQGLIILDDEQEDDDDIDV